MEMVNMMSVTLPRLLKKMMDTDADLVIGSRFIQNEGFQSTFMRRVGITYFTKLIKLLTKKTITDPTFRFPYG
jgi:hypothetical protein